VGRATLPPLLAALIAAPLAGFNERNYLDGWRRQQTVDGA